MKRHRRSHHLRQQISPLGQLLAQLARERRKQGTIAGDGVGIGQGGEPEQVCFTGLDAGPLDLLLPERQGFTQAGLLTITRPGQGG